MRLNGEALTAERGGRTIFHDVSFTLGAGEILAVTGPNGAGKSTLLRIIAGLVRPIAGTVSLAPADEDGIARQIHYVGHADALKPALTVAENLAFWRRAWRGDGLGVTEALDHLGLGRLAGLPAGVLSAGQQRRAGLARLLVARRPVWLLDEPTSALDADAERGLGRLIGDHLAHGGLAIVATHRPLPIPPTATLTLGSGA